MLRSLLLALCVTVPLAAAQVQVTLTDGQVFEGEILKEDDDSVTVQQHIAGRKGGMKATLTYQRTRIAKIEPAMDAATRYADLAAKTADTAPAQLGLAEWCRDHDLHTQAVERAQHVLTLDKDNGKAKDLLNALGLYELDGSWLNETDYCAKTGKVRYKDQLLTPAEADAAKAKDAVNAEVKSKQDSAAQAGSRSEQLTREIASVDKQIKAIEDSKVAADKEKSDATAVQTNYAELEQAVASAQRAMDAERTKDGKASQATVTNFSNAQGQLDKKRAANKSSAHVISAANDRLAALDKQMTALKAKRQDLSDQKGKADLAAADKKAEAEKAAADAKAAPAAPSPATP